MLEELRDKMMEELRKDRRLIELGLGDNVSSDSNASEDDLPPSLRNKVIPQGRLRALVRRHRGRKEAGSQLLARKRREETLEFSGRSAREARGKNYATVEGRKVVRKAERSMLPHVQVDYHTIGRRRMLEAIPEKINAMNPRSQSENKNSQSFNKA